MVNEGTFREDLYFRLAQARVGIPTLAERSDDIPALVDYFFGLFSARYQRPRMTVSREIGRAHV